MRAERDRPSLSRATPLLVVGAAVVFNLITLHAEATPVAYLNDGAIHSEMVRFATAQFRAGHLPLTSWFPQLGEGSPQFLHYQSLGAMITGAIGMLTGPDVAYAWVLYLVLATWPISVYLGARLIGFDRTAAGISALFSPFIVSTIGIGYEQRSYLFIGYGVWSQLLAMWTLPLAWGWSWRAMSDRRAIPAAAFFVSATIGLHFLTGYLAIAGILTAFACSSAPIRARAIRFGVLCGAVVLTSAWAIIPLLRFRAWASTNEFLKHGPDVNSYGARQVMSWFVTGQLFDAHRIAILTPLVVIGLLIAAVRLNRVPELRNLLALFVLSLLLFFGRTTFGSLINIVPGSADLFLRRFLMGVQLTGLFAAGIAGSRIWLLGCRVIRSWSAPHAGDRARRRLAAAMGAVGAALIIGFLTPAWTQAITTDRAEASNVSYQSQADRTDGAEIAPIIDTISRLGGRVYAGLPVPDNEIGGWGSNLLVGEVPVFKYLTRFNLDEVGYTLRTASLMTDPEVYFNDQNPADFPLFGVRWLIYPLGKTPVVPASRVMERGPYVLWDLHTARYIEVVDTVGTVGADRTDIGSRSAPFIRSDLASLSRYLTVGFAGAQPAAPTMASGSTQSSIPGIVANSSVDLDAGQASASIVARRRSVVLLKVSFDPGWQARVDGRPAPTEMISPAYVGVVVSPGRHRVIFTYESRADEPHLIGVGIVTMCILVLMNLRTGRRRRTAGSRTAGSRAGGSSRLDGAQTAACDANTGAEDSESR